MPILKSCQNQLTQKLDDNDLYTCFFIHVNSATFYSPPPPFFFPLAHTHTHTHMISHSHLYNLAKISTHTQTHTHKHTQVVSEKEKDGENEALNKQACRDGTKNKQNKHCGQKSTIQLQRSFLKIHSFYFTAVSSYF